jgi:hypothetical protein
MNLSPLLIQRFVDNNGNALVGGLLYTYAAGTTTPQATYTDSTGSTNNPNPVVANSRGEANVWLNPALSYKFILTDQYGNQIWTEDNVSCQTPPAPNSITDSMLASTSQIYAIDQAYNKTAAEIAAGVTIANAGYPPGDIRRYGADPTGITDSTVAFQSAINVCSGIRTGSTNNVSIPLGTFKISSTLTVPSVVHINGSGRGFGSSNPGTVINYIGVGNCFLVNGSYCHFQDFMLTQNNKTPSNNVGFQITNNAVFTTMARITIGPSFPTTTYPGWAAGIQTNNQTGAGNGPGYELNLDDVYISSNIIGIDYDASSAQVAVGLHMKNVYLETNATNLRLGFSNQVTNVSWIGGECILLGPGYSGNVAETNNSIGINIVNCKNFVVQGVSFETNGTAVAGATGQLSIFAQIANGVQITGNHFYTPASPNGATNHINLSANALGVVISGNQFDNVGTGVGYAVTYTSGAQFDVGINWLTNATSVWNNTWTPTATNLTVVNGTGGANYNGTWDRKGNQVFFAITITITGTCTTASVAGTTNFSLPAGAPNPSGSLGWCVACGNVTNVGLGNGSVTVTGKVYAPTWAARNESITLSGNYQCADA